MTAGPAKARSAFYSWLSGCFSFPGEAFHESVRTGDIAAQLDRLAGRLPYPFPIDRTPLLDAEGSYAEFQARYIGSFEVGAAGPPCPLYAGVYMGGRNQVWEELIRFYNLFGLHLSPENRDLPDHLSTELEFMHFLAWRESRLDAGPAATSFRKAQRDFLERQLRPWTGLLAKRAHNKDVPRFYGALIQLTDVFVNTDLGYLCRDPGESPMTEASRRGHG